MVSVWPVDELWMKFFSRNFIQVIHKSFSFFTVGCHPRRMCINALKSRFIPGSEVRNSIIFRWACNTVV